MENFVEMQREYFNTGITLSYEFRIEQLKKLRDLLKNQEAELVEAVQKDFSKPTFEIYTSEIMSVYDELDYMIKHLRHLMQPQKVSTSVVHFLSKSEIISEPLGQILIISPWNYPVNLALTPLIGAMAAGNTIVLKPSEISHHTTQFLDQLISQNFDRRYIQFIQGDGKTTQELIHQNFDHIFFTGSTRVGREVMKTAAEYLTPVTLELGGKSPAIVTADADLIKTANRIVWGKTVNAGQTCIAPDYVLVDAVIKDKLIRLIEEAQKRQYGIEMMKNEDYAQIINDKHFEGLHQLLDGQNVIYGGKSNRESRKFELTLIDEPDLNSPVMQEEIFGPILPIISYQELDEIIPIIRDHGKPLALYLFTKSIQTKQFIKQHLSFGGGSINDTLIHYANAKLPFGGVGGSGIGEYHGKHSFDTFSHYKGITEKTTLFDIPFRYAPYDDWKLKLIKQYLKYTK